MPARMNFGTGQVIDPTKGLRQTLQDISGMVDKDVARKAALERQQVLDARYQAGTDLAAVQRKQDLDRAAQLRTEDMLLKAAQAEQTGAYRTAQQAATAARDAEAIRKTKRAEELQKGEILGSTLNVPEIKAGKTVTTDVLDPVKGQEQFANLMGQVKYQNLTPVQQKQAYIKYLEENDPNYGKKTNVLVDALRGTVDLANRIQSPYEVMKSYVTDPLLAITSPEQKQQQELKALQEAKTKAPDILSEKEFIAQTFLTPEQQKEEKAQVAKDIKQYLIDDKAAGAYVKQETADNVRVPQKELLQNVELNVADYKQKNPQQ